MNACHQFILEDAHRHQVSYQVTFMQAFGLMRGRPKNTGYHARPLPALHEDPSALREVLYPQPDN